jgi:amino acid adenylation domain-containing protein
LRPPSLAAAFELQADAQPEAIAIEAAGRRMTYAQLDAASNRMARRLVALGIQREDTVGVLAQRGIETIVAVLGVVKAGGAYVPLDPDSPTERIRRQLHDARASATIGPIELADQIVALGKGAGEHELPTVVLDLELSAIASESSVRLRSEIAPKDLYAVLFTSGSTGRPKGVALEHRNLLNLLANAPELTPEPGEGALQIGAPQFDVATYEIWAALSSGARLVCHPPGRPDPTAVCRTIREHRVTWSAMPTGIFHQLAQSDPGQLADMRLLLTGGEALLPRYARRFRAACPTTRLVNIYGPTETTVFACAHEVGEEVLSDETIPVGQAVAGAQLYVLDEDAEPVAPGERGELYVGGPGISRGYLHQPELTAERYLDNRFSAEGGRLYRSGDIVRRRADGAIEIFGRTDDQVKVRGYRVEPGEIDAQLAAHPAVRRGAVVAREDIPGHRRLVAYVTLDDASITRTELRRPLQERLPPYMVPAAIVVIEQLPLNPNGKVDRAALPIPTREQLLDESSDAPPTSPSSVGETPALEIVREVFAEVLELPAVGSDDDFMELGGDSLLAIQILVRLREILEVELEIAAVFDSRTPAALAELVSAAGAPALPPLRARSHSGPVPATESQAKALTISELAAESLPYQSQAMHRIVGTLEIEALERSLSELVRRHEILRTTFKRERGAWVQNVHEPFPVRLVVEDLSATQDPERALEAHFAHVCSVRLDPGELPLARWSLARLAPDQHAFLALEHHVVHDGVSTALFLRELASLYRAELEGEEIASQPPEVQYRDFAAWQRELPSSEHGRRTLEHWREQLSEPPAPLELPFDRPRPLRQTYRGHTLRLTLPASLAEGLRTRARACGATPFMVMLATYAVLLARYGGAQEELVVGSGLANRRTLASEQLIGMIVNTVALRLELRGDPTVQELVERVRASALDAHAYQDIPFEQVVEHLAPVRSANTAPLYQTLFSFHDAPVQTLSLPGATLIPRDALPNGSAKADLSVIVVNRSSKPTTGATPTGYEHLAEEGLTVVWEYNSDLFEQSTAEGMLGHFRGLLEQFAANGDQRIASLKLEDEHQLEHRFAGPASAYERTATVAELFQARAAETPHAISVSFDGETLSYTRLERWSNRLAHRLRAWGVGRGSRVAVCMDRSLEMIVALLAVVKAGGAYVPLDPEDPSERLLQHMQALQISLVLTLGRHRNQVPGPVANLICVEDDLDLARESDLPPSSQTTALDPAYVMFTSGSTGAPKGVEVTHRAIARLVRDPDYVKLGPQETLLGLAPIAFDASTFEIWGALLNGGRLVLAPPGLPALGELADLVVREQISTLWLTAGLFNRVVDDRPELLRHLRQLLAGGEALSPDHVRRALAVLPEGAVLVNGYGPTEATTFTCAHRLRPGDVVDGPIPIGRPIAGSRVYLLDGRGEPVPVGVPGELWIGGDGVALGYVDAPELTAERFREDPFSAETGARMYDSGDRARWRADGTLEFLGRSDRQLKIRGHRVEPGEVEEALRTHPGIANAYVAQISRAAIERGLAAYLVARPDHNPTDEELRAHTAKTLPAYAVPAAWMRLERLPLTGNGKIDIAALPDPETGPEGRRRSTEQVQMDELERELVAIWQRSLDITDIHPDDDFFALGGHSLRAVELFDTIERRLGRRLPLTTIFEAPTVRGLALALREDGWRAAHGSLVALTATGSRPPLFFMTAGDGNSVGYGALARNLGPDQPFYALQPRGIDGGAPLHNSVESMAAHYLRAIRRVEPNGPYLLGGRCLGALVAYEMARRLRADGQEVTLLAVLDSGGPERHTRRLADGTPFDQFMNGAVRRAEPAPELGDIFSAEGTQRLLSWLAEPVLTGPDGTPVNRYVHEVYRVRSDVRDAYPDLAGQDARALVEWMWISGRKEHDLAERLLPAPLDRSNAAQLAPPGPVARVRRARTRVSWRTAEAVDLLLGKRRVDLAERRRERLRQASQRAWDGYRAGPYDGIITLIRSEEYRTHALLDHWYGPKTAGVVEHQVTGTHRSMLREPDVAALAGCIGALVDATVGDDVSFDEPAETEENLMPFSWSHLINM